MAAAVRMLLTLLFIAKAKSNLLPVDLSGISPGALLHLGLDTPNGGLLGGLGEILSSGVGTVGSLGQGVLGKVTALTLQHDSDQSDISNVKPWNMDSSYAAYWQDTHKKGSDQRKQVSYAEWINKIHDDYYERLFSHYNDQSSTSQEYPAPVPSLYDQIPQIGKLADDVLNGSHVYLDKISTVDNEKPKIGPLENEGPGKSNDIDGTIHFPDSEEIIKINSDSDENTKPQPARDVILVQNPNVDVTTHTPVNENKQIIILQSGYQPSTNGMYGLPTASNFVNQDVNRVPKVPTVYVDAEGHRYYIIQANENQVNQPIQPIQVTTPPSNLGYNQAYVLLNINGQQVLVPVSSLPVNGVQPNLNVTPNPGPSGQIYLYIPPNNGQTNMATNPPPVTNPVVNYITTPKYVSFEKAPFDTENNAPVMSEVTNPPVTEAVTREIGNVRDKSEGKVTDGSSTASLGEDDVRK